ncbi:MAG: UDP-N-acetylmuramoyl-tripeptide--D-alanyl-D-alanine ligase [Verrucomicrobiia bacterium]
MEKRSLTYFVEACRGRLAGGDPQAPVCGVSTDSRTIRPGELFIALVGEKFDGHTFIEAVIDKGASAVLVENIRVKQADIERWSQRIGVIVVENTKVALGDIARRYRQDFDIPVVAVCGSNGKSTTKEFIASVLAQRFATHKSPASFNNDIGVPLTLLGIESVHKAAVIEVGTNHPGELKPLLLMAMPRYGVITTIGREHLGFFGSLEAVAKEEGTIAEVLPPNGKLFVCLDGLNNTGDNQDLIAESVLRRCRAPVITVGSGGKSNWRARLLNADIDKTRFLVESPEGEYEGEYEVTLTGRHNITNALLAIALGSEFGLTKTEIQNGLKNAAPPYMRMQSRQWRGTIILNDAYNANPDSMKAALRALSELECAGKKIAVIGTMAELGSYSQAAHKEAGELAAKFGINCVIAVGEYSGLTAESAKNAGVNTVYACDDARAAADKLKLICSRGDIVLIKASRSARLEKTIEFLLSEES